MASAWYCVSDTTLNSATDYIYTRFTAPMSGNLDYVALFQADYNGNAWDEILVCPEDGNTGNPDLGNPIETFTNVTVNPTDGEWKILQLTTPNALTSGTEFFLVAHWPADINGPYIIGDPSFDSGRSAFSSDGSNWIPWTGTFLMRVYMSSNRATYSLASGNPNPSLANLPIKSLKPVKKASLSQAVKSARIPVPGIFQEENGRGVSLMYTILRGDSPLSLSDYATGIYSTTYTDASVASSTTYYYGITALYEGDQLSDLSNIISLTTGESTGYPIPYTENFDQVTAPAIPANMAVTNDNSDEFSWNTADANSRSGPNCINILPNSTLAMDDWFFSPPLTMAAGIYTVSFWYHGAGPSTPEKLEVNWGNAPNATPWSME